MTMASRLFKKLADSQYLLSPYRKGVFFPLFELFIYWNQVSKGDQGLEIVKTAQEQLFQMTHSKKRAAARQHPNLSLFISYQTVGRQIQVLQGYVKTHTHLHTEYSLFCRFGYTQSHLEACELPVKHRRSIQQMRRSTPWHLVVLKAVMELLLQALRNIFNNDLQHLQIQGKNVQNIDLSQCMSWPNAVTTNGSQL